MFQRIVSNGYALSLKSIPASIRTDRILVCSLRPIRRPKLAFTPAGMEYLQELLAEYKRNRSSPRSWANGCPETHVGAIDAAPRLEYLHRLALDPKLLALIASYLGCRPYLNAINVWWSFPGQDKAEEAQNFHRDEDALRFVKVFIYATDVTMDDGPHVFVAGSHREPVLLAPSGYKRLTDDQVLSAFDSSRIRFITGKAGDAFVEDTFGIHKGQLPVKGRRLGIQFLYSVGEAYHRSEVTMPPPPYFNADQVTSLLYGPTKAGLVEKAVTSLVPLTRLVRRGRRLGARIFNWLRGRSRS
jgi:Phytanoyl-CoA dioxygenase (PhyH)